MYSNLEIPSNPLHGVVTRRVQESHEGENYFPKIADSQSLSDVSGCVICNQQKTVPR